MTTTADTTHTAHAAAGGPVGDPTGPAPRPAHARVPALPRQRGRAAGARAAGGRRAVPARPAPAPTPRTALALLRQAAAGLAEAHRDDDPLRRYPAAYLAALRAAAAVLAVRAEPAPRGAGRNVWDLLTRVAPELGEWAAFFSSCSGTRAAAEAGIERLVSRRDADDLLRQAEQFVALVAASVPLR
jgi:hypothetical protein